MNATLTREVTSRIVNDLARATRSVPAIARRYRTTEAAVVALRDQYGPEIPKLLQSAAELRRPVRTPPVPPALPQPEPVAAETQPEPDSRPRRGDGLTTTERAECRSWCVATGRSVGSAGAIPRTLVQEWDEAGRPIQADTSAAPAQAAPELDRTVDLIRRAADVLEDVSVLAPYAAEHHAAELALFLDSASDLTIMLRRSRDAQTLIARAQTALARFGVDLDDGPTRQVLMELEVI